MAKRFFDLDEVRSIPIKEVAEAFGVTVDRYNKCKLRPEHTASVQLYTKSSTGFDRFYDFGVNEGGDVIVFVSKITNTNWQTALETLADTFGIEAVNNTDYKTRNELTVSQYSKIGVQGDLATKNLDFDLERFSMESAQKYADKYKMSVNELRKQYPEFYTHKILMGRALPYVSELRNNYFSELYDHYSLAKSVGVHDPMELTQFAMDKFTEMKNELATAEKLLHRAAKGTSLEENIIMRPYDVKEDYRAVVNGKISFQVGPVSYNDIKMQARKNDEVLRYHSVSWDDYLSLQNGFLDDLPHAAFFREEKVNMAFLPEYSKELEKSLEALKVRRAVEAELTRETTKQDDKKPKHKEYDMAR